MQIYTSRYSNKGLSDKSVMKVGITQGKPRFPLGYELEMNIKEFAPGYGIFRMTDKAAFRERFLEQLDRMGKARAKEIISLLEARSGGRDIVLLCYEDVTCKDESKNWCHRTILAEWLETRLGIHVEEYPDNGNYAAKHKEEPEAEEEEIVDQLKLF